MTNLEKVTAVLAGVSAGEIDGATRYIHPKLFLQHNPYAADGVEGLRQFIREASREELQLHVVRAFQDGPYVLTHARGERSGSNVFFDIFRFEGDLVVEHWAFSTPDAPPNRSGHTQLDGPTQARDLPRTEENKAFVRDYYQRFHLDGDHHGTDVYFNGDVMTRHEPGVRDGVGEFLQDVQVLMQHRTIDSMRMLLGEGDFVFIAAEGTHEGTPCVYLDLYRVEEHRIVEHWGFQENVPPPFERKNRNRML